MKSYVLEQYNYHAWATAKVCAHLQELPEEVCRTEIQSVFPTIHDVLAHLYVIDCGWLNLLSGKGFTEMTPENIEELKVATERFTKQTEGKSVEEMRMLFAELSVTFRAFLEQEDLEELCSYGAFQARCADVVQHVVNHGTYHRGNITAMLRQLGHAGAQTDYTLYLYLKIVQ
ncbi:DinB family protein [Paenibacillus apiarius]|uniref:DinB family protein n=1 Tax=Paenibacillus apiarius TaxID=46240 RepID=UPI003B3B68D3